MSQYLFSKNWTARSGILHSAFCILNFAFFLLASSAAWAGSNLVVNGHFSETNEFLRGWTYNYEYTGNSQWASNHYHVAVTNEGGKNHVLALRGNKWILWELGMGTQVDSDPIPFDPKGKYKFTLSAKTTGPNCRILIEGYRWRPGVKPHANPKLKEMRKCYRFALLYFGAEKAGTKGDISPAMGWTTASQTLPDPKMSKLALESFNRIQFMVIHIIAIDGTWKDPEWVYLYVDDVQLERIN